MAEVVDALRRLFWPRLEARWTGAPEARPPPRRPSPTPTGSRSGRRSTAPDGPLATSRRRARRGSSIAERAREARSRSTTKIDELESTHPAAPARAMVLNDAPQPVDPHVFIRGNPGRPGKAVPRQFLARARRARAASRFSKGSGRLELAQAIADAGQPADGPGAGQPGLARGTSARAWSPRPATSACGATRRRHPELLDYLAAAFIDERLVDQDAAPADHALEHLSAAERPPRPSALRARPREPAALAVQPPAARLRGDARLAAGRLRARSTRRSAGRPVADHRAAVPAAADGLRLHRPPEPRRPLPHLRLRRPRRDQPAAVRDDGPAAGPLPDEQPVPASSRRRRLAARLEPSAIADPTDGSAGSTVASCSAAPEPDELRSASRSSAASPTRPPRADAGSRVRPAARARPSRCRPGSSSPRCCC